MPLQPQVVTHLVGVLVLEPRDFGRAAVAQRLRPRRPAPTRRILGPHLQLYRVVQCKLAQVATAVAPALEFARTLASTRAVHFVEVPVPALQHRPLRRGDARVIDHFLGAQLREARLELGRLDLDPDLGTRRTRVRP